MIHDFMGQKYHNKINISIVLKMRVKNMEGMEEE